MTHLVPLGALDADPEPEMGIESEVPHRLLEVTVQLRLLRVGPRPVESLEREGVDVGVNVDLAARILVVPPGPTDPFRPLVDRERVDPGLLELHADRDATEACPDDHDLRTAGRAEQFG